MDNCRLFCPLREDRDRFGAVLDERLEAAGITRNQAYSSRRGARVLFQTASTLCETCPCLVGTFRRIASDARIIIEQGPKESLRAQMLRQNGGATSREQWEAILAAYGYRCAYCGIRSKELFRDHVQAVTKGGTSDPYNMVPACLSCNVKKGNREPPHIPAIRLLL